MGRGRERRDYTYEDYLEIKKGNKRKLEEIMTTPDYMEILGKKYYGERWFTVMPEGHESRIQRQKDLLSGKLTFVPYLERSIIQLDTNGNFVKEWKNAKEWAKEEIVEEKRYSASMHITKVATGKGDTAYGYKWKFKEDYEK